MSLLYAADASATEGGGYGEGAEAEDEEAALVSSERAFPALHFDRHTGREAIELHLKVGI